MKLPKKVDSLEGIDEQYHALYEEQEDGTFELTVEIEGGSPGASGGKAIKEFRERNISLMREKRRLEEELGGMREQLGEIDVEAYKKHKKQIAAITEEEERKLVSEGNVDELVKRRTTAMQTAHRKELEAKSTALENTGKERDKLRETVAGLKIDQLVEVELGRVGNLLPRAKKDATRRAREVFTVDSEGNVTPNASGETVYGDDGDPLTIGGWAPKLLEEAPHFFAASEGGGSQGGSKNDKQGGTAKKHKGKKVIKNDPIEVGRHADAIAKGEVIVEGFEPD